MEKKKATLEEPVTVNGRTLIPIVQTTITGWPNQGSVSFFSFKKPLYILVLSAGLPLTAMSTTGEPASIDEIVAKFPELKEKIQQL